MNEIFVPIKGFESRFKISNTGKLLSMNGKWKGDKIMPCSIGTSGYICCTLRDKPNIRIVRIHTLVAEHFLDKPYPTACVNHKDGNKLNNNVENLEWISIGENISHAFRIGLIDKKGEKHHMVKLTESKVREIRKLRKDGLTHQAISDKVNISRRHIGDILNGVCWGWLD